MKNQKGFTLLEMMMAVALIAIVASVAMPSWQEFVVNRKTAGASREIYTALQYTRLKAIKEGKTITVEYCDSDGDKIVIPEGGNTQPFEKMVLSWADDDSEVRESVFEKPNNIDCDTNKEAMAYNSRGILLATNGGTVRAWSDVTNKEYSVTLNQLGSLSQASGMHVKSNAGTDPGGDPGDGSGDDNDDQGEDNDDQGEDG